MNAKKFIIASCAFAFLIFTFIFYKKASYATINEMETIYECFNGKIPLEALDGAEDESNGSESNIDPVQFFANFSGTWKRLEVGETVKLGVSHSTQNLAFKFRNGRRIECEVKAFENFCLVELEVNRVGTVIWTYSKR
jgi:hypothetical protein